MTRLEGLLNDGMLEFGTIKTQRSKETAEIIGKEFDSLGFLFFNFQTIRQADYEVYNTSDKSVDLKVKTYYTQDVEKSHKVKIGNDEYEITGIDPDNKRTYMYWYLAKVGDLDGGTAVITSD